MHYRWSGKKLDCKGMTVQLIRELSERTLDHLSECVIVVLGKTLLPTATENKSVIVKMRVQSGPTDDHDREVAKREFANEWLALEDLSGSGQTPRYLTWGEIPQNDSMPYPGGYIRVLVMSKVPGQNVGQILLDLSEEERNIIRNQLVSVLEYMRKKGWHYLDPKSSNLHWDKDAKQLYLIDLELTEYKGEVVGEEITRESSIVKAFGVWNEWSRRNKIRVR